MLSSVLNKNTCAGCRFCCSFRRCSLWETPLFDGETCQKLEKENAYGVKADFKMSKMDRGITCGIEGLKKSNTSYGQMQLEYKYQTEDSEEEAACEFLDPQKGCILSDEDKPFDCKIWPLRIMKKENSLVIAMTPTCPALGEKPSEQMEKLVMGGLGKQIYDYAMEHPFMIKDYHDGFPILMTF